MSGKPWSSSELAIFDFMSIKGTEFVAVAISSTCIEPRKQMWMAQRRLGLAMLTGRIR